MLVNEDVAQLLLECYQILLVVYLNKDINLEIQLVELNCLMELLMLVNYLMGDHGKGVHIYTYSSKRNRD